MVWKYLKLNCMQSKRKDNTLINNVLQIAKSNEFLAAIAMRD